MLYLAGMVLGIGGNMLIQSILTAPDPLQAIAASSTLLAIGAVCWLATVAGDAAHGVLMFPVLKRHSERSAVGYLAARIVDAVIVAVMTLLIVIQIPVGVEFLKAGASDTSYLQGLSAVLTQANLYAYDFGMTALGVAGLILCSAFLRTGLVPRPLAVWGLAGYAIILAGSVLQILGLQLNSIHAIPGGLWEVFIGVWLIVKGFSTSAITLTRASDCDIGHTRHDLNPGEQRSELILCSQDGPELAGTCVHDDRASARARHPAQCSAGGTASEGADQPGDHRTGQGSHRADPRHFRGPGVSSAALVRAQSPSQPDRACQRVPQRAETVPGADAAALTLEAKSASDGRSEGCGCDSTAAMGTATWLACLAWFGALLLVGCTASPGSRLDPGVPPPTTGPGSSSTPTTEAELVDGGGIGCGSSARGAAARR